MRRSRLLPRARVRGISSSPRLQALVGSNWRSAQDGGRSLQGPKPPRGIPRPGRIQSSRAPTSHPSQLTRAPRYATTGKSPYFGSGGSCSSDQCALTVVGISALSAGAFWNHICFSANSVFGGGELAVGEEWAARTTDTQPSARNSDGRVNSRDPRAISRSPLLVRARLSKLANGDIAISRVGWKWISQPGRADC